MCAVENERRPLRQQKSEEQVGSCRKDRVQCRRYRSAPTPQRRNERTLTASTTTASAASSSSRQPGASTEQPDSAATTKAPVARTTSVGTTQKKGDEGPLKFPEATFSLAVRGAHQGRITLTSQRTGRCWKVIGSTRKCQFGLVVRAQELVDGAPKPGYFAIKVCDCLPIYVWHGGAGRCDREVT